MKCRKQVQTRQGCKKLPGQHFSFIFMDITDFGSEAAATAPESEEDRPYFYRTQAEKVKAIRRFLTEHIAESFTQEELSRRFDIPMTAMKSCFRSIYGEAIGSWLTRYRMNRAAEMLLRERETAIAEIGSRIGYDNAGKFTEAFKKIMMLTPSEYRRKRGIRYEN